MDVVRCDMPLELFESLDSNIRAQIDVVQIEPKDFDYSGNEKWQIAKAESTKVYKRLKKIEFEIRHEKSSKG